ncbi:hypothetical protein [Marinactinospora rubrisoli]|uniref:Uncharacterized protein n=1 Tax=Marinactinospora rubrisoli TaxID=2715399 RepID=A0ABW2KF98_9ACTN
MDRIPAPKHPNQPWPAADAAFVNLGRSGMGCLLLGVALLLFFTVCAALGAIWPERFLTGGDPGTLRIISAVIAVFFGLLLLAVLVSLPNALRTHGVAFDRFGLWYIDRQQAELVAWPLIRAIGGSWMWARKAPASSLGSAIGKEIARAALTDDGREKFAIEVFLTDPNSVAGHKRLALIQSTTQREQPPRPDLPGARLRFPVRGIGDYRKMAAHLQSTAPSLWIGEYQR